MKLGEKRKGPEEMYPSAVKEDNGVPEVVHKVVSLPIKLLGDTKFKKGDYVCIKLEGTITGIHDDEYSSDFQMKAEEGECIENEEGGDEENGTYLGKDEK